MKDRVDISVSEGVADVRLVRADKMNALDNGMFDALAQAGEQLAAMKQVRAIVLSGEGRAFCAGLDMANFAGMLGSGQERAGASARRSRCCEIIEADPGNRQ